MRNGSHSSLTRRSILEAATRLFGAKGYAGTTMRDIAAEVGILPGSLYAHIDGKETLLAEIVEVAFDRFQLLADELDASTDPPEARMRRAIEEHVRATGESRDRTLVVLHQWRFLKSTNYDRIVLKRRRYQEALVNIIEDGIALGVFSDKIDGRDAAFTILGALNWVPEWFSADGALTAEDVGRRVADTLLLGLSQRTQHHRAAA
jgi:AcrR family transcriptional regulator